MNTFMNFVKRSLEEGGMRGGVGASRGVKTSLLLTSDLLGASASSSCFPGMSAGRLTRELCRVVRDARAIAKGGGLNVIFPNRLDDPLDMEFLE